MPRYLAGRLVQAAAVVLSIAVITFFMLNVVPGDPVRQMLGEQASEQAVEQVRQQMGLDRPVPEQFARWFSGVLRGDLGTSYAQRQPVTLLVGRAVGYTARLALLALALGTLLGVAIGVTAAVRHDRWPDRVLMTLAVAGVSAPAFWVAVVLQLVFALRLGWLPLSGVRAPGSLVLPTIALGTRLAASIARVTRTSMLEVLGQDYMVTAQAKGVPRVRATLTHALRNALVPVIAIVGTQVGDVLGGSLLVETVFGIPGVGSLVLAAVQARDLPLIEGTVMYVALACVVAYLASDLLFAVVDPRVRLGRRAR